MAYASLMGVRVKRKEDPRLITGAGSYVGDMTLPGMHYIAFVRSPYAHARIRGVDTAAALASPGVVAVVTGADLAPLCEPMPVSSAAVTGSAIRNRARCRRFSITWRPMRSSRTPGSTGDSAA